MLESVYSHARGAFDPSAYARNQKATSLTRVSVTHQPLKIPPGWLAARLARSNRRVLGERRGEPADSEENEKLIAGKRRSPILGEWETRKLGPRVHLYTLVDGMRVANT